MPHIKVVQKSFCFPNVYPQFDYFSPSALLPSCSEPTSSLTWTMAVATSWTPCFCHWPSIAYLLQSSQRCFNNTSQFCSLSSQSFLITPVLLRVKTKVVTMSHKVLPITSQVSPPTLPLSSSAPATLVSLPFLEYNSHFPAPGPLH